MFSYSYLPFINTTTRVIEPSSSNAKLEQTCKLRRCYKNFDKSKFRTF